MDEDERQSIIAAWHKFLHVQGFDVLVPKSLSQNRLAEEHASHSNLMKVRANSKAAKLYNIPIGKMVVLKCFFTISPEKEETKNKKEEKTKDSDDDVYDSSYFRRKLLDLNSELVYESKIYEKVTHIPELRDNVIKWIGFQSVELESIENPFLIAKANSNLFKPSNFPDEDNISWYSLNMTITEFNDGMTLRQFFNSNPRHTHDEFIVPILFQLVWSIRILQAHDIQHNDLHLGNIFLVPNPDPKLDRTYKTDYGEIYTLPSNAPLVLLFDWDLANTSENKGPKASDPIYCEQYGICEPLNERRDIFRLFNGLIIETIDQRKQISDTVTRFLKKFNQGPIGTETVAKKSKSIGYPCNQDPSNPDICLPYEKGEPTEIHDSFYLLQSDIFKPYVVKTDQAVLAEYLTKRNAENAERLSKPKKKKKLNQEIVAYYNNLEIDWKKTHPEKNGLDLVNYGIDIVQIQNIDCKNIVQDIFTTMPEFVKPQNDFKIVMTPSPYKLQTVYACDYNGNLAVASSFHHPAVRKLRVTIFNQMLPFFREKFPQKGLYIQMVFNQLTAQRMGTISYNECIRLVKEPRWRDKEKMNTYYTGWINLNEDYDYILSAVPGDLDINKGVDYFVREQKNYEDYLASAKKEYTVKMGQLILMHKNLLRNQFNGKVPKTNFRLNIGWRISNNATNAYDEDELDEYFTTFSSPYIFEHGFPSMYPNTHYDHPIETVAFAKTLIPSLREENYNHDSTLIETPVEEPLSLMDLHINYPAYTDEEKDIFQPRLLNE